jgi:endogenous inhibitor of DNA gyrase (YacG/DUF329 family)
VTTPPKRPRRCPICRKGPLAEGQRFCSPRCQQVDLGRWLSGGYAIPAKEEEPPDADDTR